MAVRFQWQGISSDLYPHRNTISSEEDKFYFPFPDGDVMIHKSVVTITNIRIPENRELRVPQGVEKKHAEVFVKYLYLGEVDVDVETEEWDSLDIWKIFALGNSMNLLEDILIQFTHVTDGLQERLNNNSGRRSSSHSPRGQVPAVAAGTTSNRSGRGRRNRGSAPAAGTSAPARKSAPAAKSGGNRLTRGNNGARPQQQRDHGNERARSVLSSRSAVNNESEAGPDILEAHSSNETNGSNAGQERDDSSAEDDINDMFDLVGRRRSRGGKAPRRNETTSTSSASNAGRASNSSTIQGRLQQKRKPSKEAANSSMTNKPNGCVREAESSNPVQGRPQRPSKRKESNLHANEGAENPQSKKTKNVFTGIKDRYTAYQKTRAGGTIHLHPGTYSLNRVLEIAKKDIIIEGCGPDTILEDTRKNPGDKPLLRFMEEGITLRKLTIKFRPVKGMPCRWGIHISRNKCTLEDVLFGNCGVHVHVGSNENVFRRLKFIAEKWVKEAICIEGEGYQYRQPSCPNNTLEDISVQNYGIGIWVFGSTQSGNELSDIKFKKVGFGMVIQSSHNNKVANFKYECPIIPSGQDEDGDYAVNICSGSKNNHINGLECFYGFKTGMKVRSIIIGKQEATDMTPTGNKVENWTGWQLLPLKVEGNNTVSPELLRPNNGSTIPALRFD